MLLMTCRGIHTMVDVLPGGSSGAWEANTSQVQVAAEEMLASVRSNECMKQCCSECYLGGVVDYVTFIHRLASTHRKA